MSDIGVSPAVSTLLLPESALHHRFAVLPAELLIAGAEATSRHHFVASPCHVLAADTPVNAASSWRTLICPWAPQRSKVRPLPLSHLDMGSPVSSPVSSPMSQRGLVSPANYWPTPVGTPMNACTPMSGCGSRSLCMTPRSAMFLRPRSGRCGGRLSTRSMVFSNSEEKDRFGQPFPCSSPVTMKVTTTRKEHWSEVGCESLRISHCTPNWSPSIPPALDAFCMETLDEKHSPIESF